MKNECDIVKDLSFSYNDNILSNTSKEFVENHLKECDECQRFLKEIREDCTKKTQKKKNYFLQKNFVFHGNNFIEKKDSPQWSKKFKLRDRIKI